MKTIKKFEMHYNANDYSVYCAKTGYVNVYTKNDASYFGIFAHADKRKVITFSEGDVFIKEAENDQEFADEIRTMVEFYGDDFCGIDTGYSPAKKERFEALGLGEFLCANRKPKAVAL